ncbi:hypothetical protein UPYG_G00309720 [Umbra pygmaea]|uniref:Uncharacterized protein n=1 Tax=Umbra pygmaea TaxID=75934 RepID=A0ABD0WJ27_UMBPY
MDLSQLLRLCILSILGVIGSSTEVGELCRIHDRVDYQVYSVPGDAAMFKSTLLEPKVFNYSAVPYNISWYQEQTGKELTSDKGKVLVQGSTLWIFDIKMEDGGYFTSVVRTPSGCFKQSLLLNVNQSNPDTCSRPYKAEQHLTNKASGLLSCPLTNYMEKVNNYSLQWYKECKPIMKDDPLWGRFDSSKEHLYVRNISPEDRGLYTCTMTFNLEGLSGRISETIIAKVNTEYDLSPSVVEPINDTVKADLGSFLRKRCQVYVPFEGKHKVELYWSARNDYIPDGNGSVFQEISEKIEEEGVLLELTLNIPVLRKEDFYINYTCHVSSYRGFTTAYFTLLPTDPNYLLTIGVLLTSLASMFVVGALIYRNFKIDIVLSFRRMFPFFYRNLDSDGKVYDAYIAYPQHFWSEASGKAEMFALHVLPQVLEGCYGYKLFIPGRDSLPGKAVVDAVEESMQASRRLILLYSGTTFCNGSYSDSGSGTGAVDAWQSFERQAAMHRALLEGSLQVILVELEEITPTRLASFPQSVLHLRNRQGAICWWKSSRTRRTTGLICGGWSGEDEREERKGELDSPFESSPSLATSSRFWRELRYYMPVRGKRTTCPQKNSLLTL